MMKSIVTGLALALAVSSVVVTWSAHEGRAVAAQPADTKDQKIRRAMSAGPASITKDAKIVEMDEKGNTVVLRDGNNGWTCFAGQPGTPHWMLFWPFDPKETGLSDKPKDTGTWIMWAGTPYAHLMINHKP